MQKSARKRQEQLAKKRKQRDRLKKARILASKNAMNNHVANAPLTTHLGSHRPALCVQDDEMFGGMVKKDLKEKVKRMLGDKVEVVEPPKEYNHRKLSEILWDYILEEVGVLPDDCRLAKSTVNFIVSAWNVASSLPNTDSDADLESTLYDKAGFQQMDDTLKKMFCDLVKKKRLRHPDDNRFIVEFDLAVTPQGYNLNVASLIHERDI